MNKVFQTLTWPAQLALRSQKISFVFSRYGLGGSLAALGIECGKRGLNWVRITHAPPVSLDAVFGRNLALTCIRLGPTFIKLGQLLASRSDLIGEPAAEELKILFDRVPAIPIRHIRKIIESEVGRKSARELIADIDPTALASASLSQTHRARLHDGTPVILKVQKPGVAQLVRLDLSLIEGFVRPLDLVYPSLQLFNAFKEFKAATLREIDYREEAKNIDRFRKNYSSFFAPADVIFPRYFPKLTTEKMIALEPMHGQKISDLKKGSTVARKAASASLAAVLEQIFDHGFFHADPHAGNLFFMEDEGTLGFIDLGMVGQLNPSDKRKFLKVLLAILQRDRNRLAKALYELGTPTKRTKYETFEKGIHALLDEINQKGVDSVRMDQLVNKLLAVTRKNGIIIPNRYTLMIRSCLLIEGVAKSLDPQISLFKIATPIVASSLIKSYNPLNWFSRWVR